MEQPGKTVWKSSPLSEISSTLRRNLTWVGWINSHVNDLFLQNEIYHSAEIWLRWDVSPGWEWLIVLIQRSFFSASSPRCKTSRETEVVPFALPLLMEMAWVPRVFAKFQLIKYTADSLLRRYSANCELSKWIHYGKGYRLIFLLQNLAILINFEKSVLQPCQRTEFSGIVVDSIDNTLTLSQEKVNTITDLWQCKKLLNWLGN